MKNLPKKEIPHKNSSIVNIKTSVNNWLATRSDKWSENLVGNRSFVRYQDAKCYPLLLKTFEENGGYADRRKIDEIEAVIDGELTRMQLCKWFYDHRNRCGMEHQRKCVQFSKRARSVLSRAFAKNSFVRETDEIEEALDGELTRTQILRWFRRKRKQEGITGTLRNNKL